MVISDVPSDNPDMFPCAYHLDYAFQLSFNIFVSHGMTTVFGSPNQMIFTTVCTMVEIVQPSVVLHKKSPPFFADWW